MLRERSRSSSSPAAAAKEEKIAKARRELVADKLTAVYGPNFTLADRALRGARGLYLRLFADMERMQSRTDSIAPQIAKQRADIERKITELLPENQVYFVQADSTPADGWWVDTMLDSINFSHGRMPCGICIVLVQNGAPVFAMADFAQHDTQMISAPGMGATVADLRARVSGRAKPENIVLNIHKITRCKTAANILGWAQDNGMHLRQSGCWQHSVGEIASGRADLGIGFALNLNEQAFTLLFMQESGGQVWNTQGKPATLGNDTLITGNLDLLAKVRKSLPF